MSTRWALAALLVAVPMGLLAPATRAADDPIDSLSRCEGIMAYRLEVEGISRVVGGAGLRDRQVRSRAVEGALKERWLALLTGPGLRREPDCTPVCAGCAGHAKYTLYFPPLPDSVSATIFWDDRRVHLRSGSRTIGHHRLGSGDTAWVALLQETFPGDSVTAALVAADSYPRAAGDLPLPEETVFVETLPSVVKKIMPQYPPGRMVMGVGAEVEVMALVGAKGRVLEAHATRPVEGFDEAAVTAVAQWRFTPAGCGGEPVPVWVVVPVKFTP